jgi:S1-C subfamily serine protease
VNGTVIGDASDWEVTIGRLRPGDAVNLRILHRRGDRDVALTAAARPATGRTAVGLHLQQTRDGAVVLAVEAGTAAAGVLQAGDFITQVDELRRPTGRQLQQAFDMAERGVLVLFTRNGIPRAAALER